MSTSVLNRLPMSFIWIALSLVSGASLANDIRSTEHPIIGYWEASDPNQTCKETYQFAANGTGAFTSGDEILTVSYDIDPQPDANGFFKMKHVVKSSNNKEDCTRMKAEIGVEKLSYLLFQPDGYSFIACDNDDASLETCFGPMQLKDKVKSN